MKTKINKNMLYYTFLPSIIVLKKNGEIDTYVIKDEDINLEELNIFIKNKYKNNLDKVYLNTTIGLIGKLNEKENK